MSIGSYRRSGMTALCIGLAATVTATATQTATVATPAATSVAEPKPAEVFNYGRFGAVSVYRGRGEPRNVALFLSGDGGWNLGVVSMARRLADKNSVVAGIDIRHYLAQLESAGQKACRSPPISRT